MKVLVVDPVLERRAELEHAICELPHVEVCGTASTALEAREVLAAEPIDMVLEGALSPDESSAIATLSMTYHCELVRATSPAEAAEIIGRSAREYADAATPSDTISTRSRRRPPVEPMSYAFLAGPERSANTGTQTVDLREWLPSTVANLRSLLPEYVEVVVRVADGTLPVRCVPSTLEDSVFQLLMQACTPLVWGGTIWLMADTRVDGLVRLTVLENGIGKARDLTLSASPRVYS